MNKQYACFRFCLHPQNYEKSSVKNKAFLSKWYFFTFFLRKPYGMIRFAINKDIEMIFIWNYDFIIKILELFKIYAQILIAHFSSVLRNIELHFFFKCPKRYILGYLLIKLHENTKFTMSIFNKLDFFTVCIGQKVSMPSCKIKEKNAGSGRN